jgi:DNA-directed RNA polymerase specialized sigma24 family protein
VTLGAIRWTQQDTLRMLLLRGDGLSRRELANALSKSEHSVKRRLERIRRGVGR